MTTDDDAAVQPVGGLETLDKFDEQASERIRSVLHAGHLFFSVFDVVGLLTESSWSRNYGLISSAAWRMMRASSKCQQNVDS